MTKKLGFVVLALFAVVLFSYGQSQADLSTVTWMNPSPQGNNVNAIIWNSADTYVAVGDGGLIMTSPDGSSWTIKTSGTTVNLQDVAYGGGYYVAVGPSGTVLYSTDASTWTKIVNGSNLRSVAYGGGYFVIVSGGTVDGNSSSVTDCGTVYRASTPNGTWSTATISSCDITNNVGIQKVIYANSKFVAVGQDSTATPYLASWTSTDGGTWSTVNQVGTAAANAKFRSVAYGVVGSSSAQFIAVGDNSAPVVATPTATASYVYYSSDGTTWTAAGTKPDAVTLLKGIVIAGGKGLIVGTCNSGATCANGSSGKKVWYATSSSSTWSDGSSNITTGSSGWFNATTYGSSFVAVGSYGSVQTATDPTSSWTNVSSGTKTSSYQALYGIAYGAYGSTNTGIVGGASGIVLKFTGTGSGLTNTTAGSSTHRGVAVGNNIFALVNTGGGTTGVYTSSDGGSTWTARTTTSGDVLYGVAYGYTSSAQSTPTFVAVGSDNGTATPANGIAYYSSTDASSWTRVVITTDDVTAYGVTYGLISSNAMFVAGGVNATTAASCIFTSIDGGATWTARSACSSTGDTIMGVAYGNGTLVAVGHTSSSTTPLVKTSTDGTNWTDITSTSGISSVGLYGIAYSNGTWVAVGKNSSGQAKIYSATNLSGSWTARPSSGNIAAASGLNATAYGSGYFFYAGDNGTLMKSDLSAAVASLSPTSNNYGNVSVGTPSTANFTLTNSGTVDLVVTSIYTGGAPFTVATGGSNPCTSLAPTLTAGSSCTLSVTFTPTSVASSSGTLTVTSNATTVTASLSGTGTQASLAISPATKAFGNVSLNSIQSQTFTITNNSGSSVTLSNISLSTSASGAYSLVTVGSGLTCAGTTPTIANGSNCTVSVTYTPTVTGATTTTLTAAASSQSLTATASISGTGVEAAISLTPTSKNFGSVNVGNSSSQIFEISNTGTADLVVSNISLTSGSPFTVALTGTGNTCATTAPTVAAGGNCTFTVTYTPTTTAAVSATLTITSNASTSPTTATLQGTGGAPSSVPTLTAPTGTITTNVPTYTWSAVTDATWYWMWVDDGRGYGTINTWYKASDICSGSTCSVTPKVALWAGQANWWVAAWNSTGGLGNWSSMGTFTVGTVSVPGVPTLVSPSGTASVMPTYKWNAVSGATWYGIYVQDTTGLKVNSWYKAEDVNCKWGGWCYVKPTTTLAAGAAKFWVQAYNSGGFGTLSSEMAFTVDSNVVPAPGSLAVSGNAYSWSAIPNATYYWVLVYDIVNNSTVINSWTSASAAGCGAGIGTCTWTSSTTLATGHYNWWVAGWNSTAFTGEWRDRKSVV